MGPEMHQKTQLPSLEMLMRETFSSGAGQHGHGKFQSIHSSTIDSNRNPSPGSYQQLQGHSKQLGMSIPRIPLTTTTNSSHITIQSESMHCTSMLDTGSHPSLAIPSPISPGTRCPSFDNVYTASCQSPTGSGPTTPISENGGATHHYNPNRHIIQSTVTGRSYEGESGGYGFGRSQSPLSAHRITQHGGMMHNSPLPMGIDADCQEIMEHDSPMMMEHHEEKITKQEKRRRNHLNSEKRRRENIKGGMDALVDLVPSCRNIQESKANILKKTRDYVNQLLHGYKESQTECKRLKTENSELRRLLALHGVPQQGLGQPDSLVYRSR
ncbi:hypothetical protein DFH27DRAFT_150818 [Peziza echinospora]|nr:hypothetical protein DFH27DRAFT_150818 [Peziza echinospora]